MYKTDVFFNFIEEISPELIREDAISLKRAYELYKAYCEERTSRSIFSRGTSSGSSSGIKAEQFHDKYKVDEVRAQLLRAPSRRNSIKGNGLPSRRSHILSY